MKRLIATTVGVTIAIITLAAVLMPVLEDSMATSDKFTNEGYYTMDKLDSDTDVTIKWAKTSLNIVNINGTDIDMSSFVELGKSYTLVGSDSIILRYEKDGASFAGLQFYSSEGYLGFHSNSAAEYGNEITVTVANDQMAVTSDGTTPVSKTYTVLGTDGYIINEKGTGTYAIMKKANVPAYVNGDSQIRLIGVSVAAGPNSIALFGAGTLDDGITVSTIYKPNNVTTVSYSDPVPTYTAVSDHKDLDMLDKYEFTITYDASTYDATYSYFIVPTSVTAERSVHLDPAQIGVLAAIPIIILAAILMLAVTTIARNRD